MPPSDLQIHEVRDASLNTIPDELESGVVHLWQRSLLPDDESVRSCHELLLAEERERASRYRVERPRGDYILTRGTLRSLLSQYLGILPRQITFQYTQFGKPFLQNCNLHFNVSHTDGLALMAFVRSREIGIDVERVRPQTDVRQLAERFFSVRERQSLHDLVGDDLHAAFFRCWTRKEAYIKAVGEGLSLPLHKFDVSIEPDPKEALLATRPDPNEAARWMIRNIRVAGGYAAAFAVSNGRE